MSGSLERAHLVLADGTTFAGRPYGACGRAQTTGEAVFTTTMMGYQEVLTDPSYCGQIVVMTAAQIGNVGVNAADSESRDGRPSVAGFVIGGVGIASGVLLLLTAPKASDSSSRATRRITPYVGLGSVGAAGRF